VRAGAPVSRRYPLGRKRVGQGPQEGTGGAAANDLAADLERQRTGRPTYTPSPRRSAMPSRVRVMIKLRSNSAAAAGQSVWLAAPVRLLWPQMAVQVLRAGTHTPRRWPAPGPSPSSRQGRSGASHSAVDARPAPGRRQEYRARLHPIGHRRARWGPLSPQLVRSKSAVSRRRPSLTSSNKRLKLQVRGLITCLRRTGQPLSW